MTSETTAKKDIQKLQRAIVDGLEDVKAQEIMLNSPIGVALTKEGMWASLEIPGLQAAIDMENRQQIMASFSDDARETQRAKREGRPPQYRS